MEGLTIIDNFIDEETEQFLLDSINKEEWDTSLKRKTQHYGYKYLYKKVALEPTTPIPDFLQALKEEINYNDADQVIINHYYPGQGISSHIDKKIFDNKIVSISLNSGISMNIGAWTIYLKPRSCLILEGHARWDIPHEIVARKSDTVNGKKIKRSERISITFRKLL